MGDHLNRRTKIFPSSFFIQYIPVDFSCSQIGILIQILIYKPFVMPQIQIRFCPILGHIYFAMLIRTHGSGIYVNIWI